VLFDELLGIGQAKSGADVPTRERRTGMKKSLENIGDIVPADPGSGVGNDNNHVAGRDARQPDIHDAVSVRKLDCVVDDASERLADAGSVNHKVR
jgi:hypothetical protein